jgi:hypothetical protein
MSGTMEKPRQETPQSDDAAVSASRLIMLDERRNYLNSEIIFRALNRTLFVAVDATIIVAARSSEIPTKYFLLVAVILCGAWLWEMILTRSKIRTISNLVTQIEFQEYGQHSSAKLWVDAVIQLNYLSDYGSSTLTSFRWRFAEPIAWLAFAILIIALF